MIHGKITCPNCNQLLELSATKAPTQQAQTAKAIAPSGSIGALLDSIDDDTLTGKNAEFVMQTRERYAQYKEKTLLSEKQLKWLNDIASGEANEW